MLTIITIISFEEIIIIIILTIIIYNDVQARKEEISMQRHMKGKLCDFAMQRHMKSKLCDAAPHEE